MDDDIGWVQPAGVSGRIAMLPLPGLVILRRGERVIEPDLQGKVLDGLAADGVSDLACLLCDEEVEVDDLVELSDGAASRDIRLTRWPIDDFSAPGPSFDGAGLLARVGSTLREGRSVGFACLAGYGRSGMMAARILIAYGMAPEGAIAAVRMARPGAIESDLQLAYLRALAS